MQLWTIDLSGDECQNSSGTKTNCACSYLILDNWEATKSPPPPFQSGPTLQVFVNGPLKMDMPILTCIFFTFNWLTLTSEMHFVVSPWGSFLFTLQRQRKYAPLGMRLFWKYIRSYFLVYHLTSHFLLYFQNYKEFEAESLDLQIEKYGLSFDIKTWTTSGWVLGDENAIGIRSFNFYCNFIIHLRLKSPGVPNCIGASYKGQWY